MVELGAAQPGPMAEQITGATPGTGEKIPEHAALGYRHSSLEERQRRTRAGVVFWVTG